MKARFLTLFAVVVFHSYVWAATPSTSAKDRAVFYQSEAKDVLVHNKWRIVSDKPGTLVEDKPYSTTSQFSGPGIFTIEFGRVTIKFSPQSAAHTKCTAVIVGYGRGTDGRKDLENRWIPSQHLTGPIPLNTSDNTKEIQDTMAKAEKELVAAHPEFAAR